MSGTLYLTGVGPGDPELLTLKAVRLLASVPVVAFPQSSEGRSLAYEIAAPHIGAAAKLLPIRLPMETDPVPAQAVYDTAAALILRHLAEGRDVAWLCEGDPLFYGSAMYLVERVAAEAMVVAIPGVTSLTAVAAAVLQPLAGRSDVLKVLPATLDDEALRTEMQTADSIAIIKVGRHFDRVRALLVASGLASSAIVVEHATLPRQRITPLLGFAATERLYFSTILCTPARRRTAAAAAE